MQKRWKLLQAPAEKADRLQKQLKIRPTLCKILVQRGIETYTAAKDFFRPQLSHLHDPWLMKDMEKAVLRIEQSISLKEKLLVFGDYDVDGTTSVAAMYQFLRPLFHENIDFYIPHRYKEGYGISKAGIDFAHENGFSLIVSLDCGIKSVELVDYAKTLGIGFIICDHHMPDKQIPDAYAILNPKQPDCKYPYKELCGCGVGFKLMHALAQKLNMPDSSYLNYLDLVATAIAADIVPMTGENRVLAHFGLKKINSSPCAGIKALMKLGGISQDIHINNLVFVIAPRINAAGRMDDAKKAVQLFLEQDEQQALLIAEQLQNDNIDRKEADISITTEALNIINSDVKLINRKTTVLYQEHWHKGVVGIVASRLIESFYRPTVILTKSGDIAGGSARSVNGFNLYEAIHACREHLLGYGGHFAAAGLTLSTDQIEAFSQKFEEIVSASITEEQLTPEIAIDAEIRLTDITHKFYNILCQMEPFGPDNTRPVFLIRNIVDSGLSKIVKDNHIRFVLKENNFFVNGIGFNMADKFALLESKTPVDIVFTIDKNNWNGEQYLQLKVLDFKPFVI